MKTIYIPPRNFIGLNRKPICKKIWDFLNEHDNIVKMKAACYFKKPAAQIMSEGLLEKFGEAIRDDQIKQLIGSMIRQILENEGYEHEKHGMKINDEDNIFTKASRYSKVVK